MKRHLARLLYWLAFKLDPRYGVNVTPLSNGGWVVSFEQVPLAQIHPKDIQDIREGMEKLESENEEASHESTS